MYQVLDSLSRISTKAPHKKASCKERRRHLKERPRAGLKSLALNLQGIDFVLVIRVTFLCEMKLRGATAQMQEIGSFLNLFERREESIDIVYRVPRANKHTKSNYVYNTEIWSVEPICITLCLASISCYFVIIPLSHTITNIENIFWAGNIDEAGHWVGRLARAEQVGRPRQHKVKGPTDNKTLSLTASRKGRKDINPLVTVPIKIDV